MTMNVENIKYIGGRNLCRDEELDRKIWDIIPHGKITHMENNVILKMAKRRKKIYGGLLRENQHICWHLVLQLVIKQRLKLGYSPLIIKNNKPLSEKKVA